MSYMKKRMLMVIFGAVIVFGIIFGSFVAFVYVTNDNIDKRVNYWLKEASQRGFDTNYFVDYLGGEETSWWLHITYMEDFLSLAEFRSENKTINFVTRTGVLTITEVEFWFKDKELNFIYICDYVGKTVVPR